MTALLLLFAFFAPQPKQDIPPAAQTWWRHLQVLAADNMEGRETGSAGYRRASDYVITELKKAGVQPAGSAGFFQSVPFRQRQIVEKDCSVELLRDGKAQPIQLGEEMILSTRIDLAPQIEAPLVFAGYGLRIPEKNYDDFAGLNVKGKIIVILSGVVPPGVPGALSSHYQSTGERGKLYRELGVVGTISVSNPASMDIPWSRVMVSRTRPSMALDEDALDETKGAKFSGAVNPAHAETLFAGSGHSFAELLDIARQQKPIPHFQLPLTLRAKTHMEYSKLESQNIIGKIPGSDPKLKNEYVVLSAHLDHLGIGDPIPGDPKNDRIYNGAMDNGSGSASLLDVAQRLKGKKLKRSVLLVFVTGEEKGLLGSRYFTVHPTVPAGSIIADVNTDMYLPIIPLKSLIIYGLGESDVADVAAGVAKQQGLGVQPDPEPQRNHFIRSDQYNFIRAGVPSIAMKVGFAAGSAEEETTHRWTKERYHAPSDDLDQPIDFAAAAKFDEVLAGIAQTLANEAARPQWKPDSFFKRFAK
jgi:hypothetical protein